MYCNVCAFYSSLVKDCRLAIESSNFQIFNQRTLKILLCLTLVTRPFLNLFICFTMESLWFVDPDISTAILQVFIRR